jgi:N-acetylmuramic acid 6-phosphate etherase
MEADKAIERLSTEIWDRAVPPLETLGTLEILAIMNSGDQTVPMIVGEHLEEIAQAVELIYTCWQRGGRMFYVGAGTSGRLGILDAAECPPTFNTDPSMVQAIMAGGPNALIRAVEGAEDSTEAGQEAVRSAEIVAADVVVGLSASGRTPFVLGALVESRNRGARTVGVSCNQDPEMKEFADVSIAVPTGAEVVMGSTRLKAGTATKLVLNMLTTAAMIRFGKTFRNLMVDVKATNYKLRDRSRRIVMLALDISYDDASGLLEQCGQEVKTAIATGLLHVSPQQARLLLAKHQGRLADIAGDQTNVSNNL